MVRVKNTSSAPFVDRFDGKEYKIPAGRIARVPAEAVSLWLGDPSKEEDVRRAVARRGGRPAQIEVVADTKDPSEDESKEPPKSGGGDSGVKT